MKENEAMPLLDNPKKPSFVKCILICTVIMLCYMSGYISYTPLFSQFLRHRVAQIYFNVSENATNNPKSPCDIHLNSSYTHLETEIQKMSSKLLLYFTLPGSIAAILSNLILGSYSDFLGRRFLFFVPCFGAFVKGLSLSLIAGFGVSLNWMYLGLSLEGLCGSFSGFLLAVFAYTSDVTPSGKKRTLMIASMEGALAISGSLGQLAVGYVIQDINFLYASVGVTAMFFLSMLVSLLFLPESMMQKTERQWNPVPHIKNVFSFFFTRGTCRQRGLYILAMLVFSFGIIGILGRSGLETLYQMDRPFCWRSLKIAYYGALKLSSGVLFSVLFLKVFQGTLRAMTIALIGLVFGIAAFVEEGLAVNDLMLYLTPVIGVISFNAVPVARATMSTMTSPTEQGALFSSIAAVETICYIVSTSLYSSVYLATVEVFRGAVFITIAGFWGVAALFAIIFLYVSRGGVPNHDLTIEVTQASINQQDTTVTKHKDN